MRGRKPSWSQGQAWVHPCPPTCSPWPRWFPSVFHTCHFFAHRQILSPQGGLSHSSPLCPVNILQIPAPNSSLGTFPDAPPYPFMYSHSPISLPLLKLIVVDSFVHNYRHWSLPQWTRAMRVGLWLELPMDPGTELAHGRGSKTSC